MKTALILIIPIVGATLLVLPDNPHGSSLTVPWDRDSSRGSINESTLGDTSELVFDLTWVGRSTEIADSCPYGPTMGGKLDEGLALTLDPDQVIFDNGEYTPPQNKNVVPPGTEWASWPHWHPYTFELRHLRATFDLPSIPDTVFDLVLFSPYYIAFGDILPINDNLYLYLNGMYVGVKGTYYEAKNAGMGGSAAFANETDGWYEDSGFGPLPSSALKVGENLLDFVTEERVAWGGIGRLDLKLLVGVSDCDPIEPWQVRSQGYWRRQCKENAHEDICAYVDSIRHLSEHFITFDCDSVCDLMNIDPPENDMCRKARRQFLALLLNIASGKLAVCNCLEDGHAVEDVIAEIDSILSASDDHAACERAKTLADDLNNGRGIVICENMFLEQSPVSAPSLNHSATLNPFATSTVLRYELQEPQPVRLQIYDNTGRFVLNLVDEIQTVGSYGVEWDGRDARGRRLPAGVYFSRLSAGTSVESRSLVLIK